MTPQISNVHNDAVNNLAFIKKQQWAMTNYVALLYAGIVTLYRTDGHSISSGVAGWLIIAIGAYGTYLLVSTQKGMERFRRRLAKINSAYFTADELDLLELLTTPKPRGHDVHIFLGLLAVILGGAGLAWLAVVP